MRETSRVLLDSEMDHPIVQEIRDALETDGDTRITDLRVMRVGRSHFACVVSVIAELPLSPCDYKDRLAVHEELVFIAVEVVRCPNLAESASEEAA